MKKARLFPAWMRSASKLASLPFLFICTLIAPPPSMAQPAEALRFSIEAYDELFAGLPEGQETAAIGDMLFKVDFLKAWRGRLQAKLEGKLSASGAFDFASGGSQWPESVIPYSFDESVPENVKTLFESAMREWQLHANLNFVPRNGHANYLRVKFTGYADDAVMNSFVGMQGGPQDLNIAGWGNKFDCTHELGHALGMIHEQCRGDRDTYVRIIAENLPGNPATDINFAIVPGSINRTDYDFDSLMHYPRNAFALDPALPVMLALSPNEHWSDGIGPEEMGQKTHLSAGDKAAMAAQYGVGLSIGGKIQDAAGNPLAGVQVTLSGGSPYRGPNPVRTAADGSYAFTGIPQLSGTYTLTPSQPGASFTQPSRNVTARTFHVTVMDFTSIDSAPPDLGITLPAVSGIYPSLPEASGTSADAVNIREVRVALARTSDLAWWNWNANAWGGTEFDWSSSVRIASGTANWTAALPALPVGGYQLHVQSVDGSDNASPWLFRHFFVDPEPPEVRVTQPLADALVSKLFTIRGTATDGNGTGIKDGKVYFTLYQGGDFWTGFNWKPSTSAQDPEVLLSADVVAGQWSYNAVPGLDNGGRSTSGMRNGTYALSLFARDNAGNLSTPEAGVNSIQFTVDNSPPGVAITSPAGGTLVKTNFAAISGTATDSRTLQSVHLYLYRYSDGQFWDGSAWGGGGSAILPVAIDPDAGTWTSTGPLPSVLSRNPATRLSNGGYNIIVFAIDSAGNETRTDSVITVEYFQTLTYTRGSHADQDPYNNNDDWDNPANWSPYGVPGPDDIALISSGSPGFTGTKTLKGVQLAGGEIRGGTLIIPHQGTMTWTGGKLTADLIVNDGGELILADAGTLTISSGRRVEINGTSRWEGSVTVSGSGGVVFLNQGRIIAGGNTTFAYYNNGVSPIGRFENRGTIEKAGPGTLRFSADYGGWLLTNSAALHVAEGTILLNNQVHLGGTISGPGKVLAQNAEVTAGTAVNLDGGTFELASGTLSGSGSFGGSGTFIWSGGTLKGDIGIDSPARMSLVGSSKVIASGARLRNAGSVAWEAGAIHASGKSRIENSGLFEILGNVIAYHYNNGVSPRAAFENTGTLKVKGGSLVAFSSDYDGMLLNNLGEVRVEAGILRLGGGGLSSGGTYYTEAGVIELIRGGEHVFSGDILIAGPGTFLVDGASVNGQDAAFQIAPEGIFEHRSGNASGAFAIEGPGTFIWSGGRLNASMEWRSNLTTLITGEDAKNLEAGHVLQLGTVRWSGAGPIRGVGAAQFENRNLFLIEGDASFDFYNNGVYPAAAFINAGVIRKTGGTGATRFDSDYGGWTFLNRGQIDIQSGTLDLENRTTLADGGSFHGAGAVRVIQGTTTFAGTNWVETGRIELLSGEVQSDEGLCAGPGTFAWSGGTISGAVNFALTNLLVMGEDDKQVGGSTAIRNLGHAYWTGPGWLRLRGQSVIENRGTFEVLEETTLHYYNSGVYPKAAFINSGLFVKSGAGTQATWHQDYGGAAFGNSGRVEVRAGTLALGGGGLWNSGAVDVLEGADLNLFSGEFQFNDTIQFSGGSKLSGGSVLLNGGTNQLAPGAVFEIEGGTLEGAGAFAGPGTLGWSGGNFSGEFTISPETAWNISGEDRKRFARGTIDHYGTATWSGSGFLHAEGASTLNNHGTFIAANDSEFTFYNNGIYPRARFNNLGLFQKTSAGITAFDTDYGGWAFFDQGTLRMDAGVLSLRTESHLTNSVIRGPGRVRIDGADVLAGGVVTIHAGSALELASGEIAGAASFTGAGIFEWSGGFIRGEQVIASAGKMLLSGSARKEIAGSSTLRNDGLVTWTGTGAIHGAGQSRFINNGTLVAASDASFSYYNNGVYPPAALENHGIIRKTSAGPTRITPDYGGWSFANAGTLELEAGLFDVGGRYEPSPAARTVLTLGGAEPGAGYAQIAFPSEASLAGSLVVNLAPGYQPGTNLFVLATWPSRSGEFASPALPPAPVSGSWKLNYAEKQLELAVVQAQTASLAAAAAENGVFRLSLTGPAGQYALLQASTNLIDWTTIQTNQPFTGTFDFEDHSATNRSTIYRTLIIP